MIHRFVDLLETRGDSLPFVVAEATGNWYFNVWRVIDGVLTRITDFESPEGTGGGAEPVIFNPRLSFDGNWICMQVGWQDASPFAAALYTVPALGGAYTNVWDDAGVQDYLLHPTWHPDNDHIVFTYGPTIPSTNFTFNGAVCRAQRTNPGATPDILWTPNGPTGGTSNESAFRPHYSPDGTQIAFFVNATASGADETRQGLWVMDADGTNDTLIDNWEPTLIDGGYAYVGTQLAWSNDSAWIAFTDSDRDDNGTFSVWKIRPDGTDKTLLKAGTGDNFKCRIGHGAWSADDTTVICSATEGGIDTAWRIFLLDADGTGETEVVDATNGPSGPGDFSGVYGNPFTGKMEWTFSAGGGQIAAANRDGTDQAIIADVSSIAVSGQFAAGEGLEWL